MGVVPPHSLAEAGIQVGPELVIVHVPVPGPLPERNVVSEGAILRIEHRERMPGETAIHLFDIHPSRHILTPLGILGSSDVTPAVTGEYHLP